MEDSGVVCTSHDLQAVVCTSHDLQADEISFYLSSHHFGEGFLVFTD